MALSRFRCSSCPESRSNSHNSYNSDNARQDHFSSSKWQTQFYGRKRWILHPPELSRNLYYGRVDPFFPDFRQYPLYKEAMDKRFDIIVEQGEPQRSTHTLIPCRAFACMRECDSQRRYSVFCCHAHAIIPHCYTHRDPLKRRNHLVAVGLVALHTRAHRRHRPGKVAPGVTFFAFLRRLIPHLRRHLSHRNMMDEHNFESFRVSMYHFCR